MIWVCWSCDEAWMDGQPSLCRCDKAYADHRNYAPPGWTPPLDASEDIWQAWWAGRSAGIRTFRGMETVYLPGDGPPSGLPWGAWRRSQPPPPT